jgi:hypothetical protein
MEKNKKKIGMDSDDVSSICRVHDTFPYMEGEAVLNVKTAIK